MQKALGKKVIIKRKYFLPECTVVLRSRLNTRNKYKVHLQTFIHARLQQPSRCPPPCWWCIPAERWNGEKHDCFPPLPFETEAGLVKDRRALRVWVSLCAWTVMSSEWMSGADRSLSLHTHALTRPKKMKWKRRRNKFEWLPDTRDKCPGLGI